MIVTVKYYKDNKQVKASRQENMNIFHCINSIWKHINDYDKVTIIFDDVIEISRNMTYTSKRSVQSDIMAIFRKYAI